MDDSCGRCRHFKNNSRMPSGAICPPLHSVTHEAKYGVKDIKGYLMWIICLEYFTHKRRINATKARSPFVCRNISSVKKGQAAAQVHYMTQLWQQ